MGGGGGGGPKIKQVRPGVRGGRGPKNRITDFVLKAGGDGRKRFDTLSDFTKSLKHLE